MFAWVDSDGDPDRGATERRLVALNLQAGERERLGRGEHGEERELLLERGEVLLGALHTIGAFIPLRDRLRVTKAAHALAVLPAAS